MQLFTESVQQVKASFPSQIDLRSVTRVCQLLEGLPLGIELAVSALRVRTLSQLTVAIESGKDDLAITWKDVPERHRSLQRYRPFLEPLTEPEKNSLCSLSVFRGGFTAKAADKVADATSGVLNSLIDSLVRYDPQQERYDLHELYGSLLKKVALKALSQYYTTAT